MRQKLAACYLALSLLALPLNAKILNSETMRKHNIHFVDATWSDLYGKLKEITLPISKLDGALENNLFFDGSSIEGFTKIFESDLRLKLDEQSFWFDPESTEPFRSVRVFCDVLDTEGKPYSNDPRSCLKRVMYVASEQGYECVCGTEIEFFLFKEIDGQIVPVDRNGYCGIEEDTTLKLFKEELLDDLIKREVSPEKVHHEVAGGQFEIVLEHSDPLKLADRIQLTKHRIKLLSQKFGFKATFMPKPILGANGTGMHIHVSLRSKGRNAFFDIEKECYLSDEARSFISGLLKHAPGISSLLNSEVNSSKRLVPGYEAPVYLCWGDKNRSAAIRVPEVTREALTRNHGAPVRIELRWPDPECNPYLAFAAIFKAGLDGILNNTQHIAPINRNLYNDSPEQIRAAGISVLPGSLEESLDLFEKSEFAKELLSKSLHAAYLKGKRLEWSTYLQNSQPGISDWEFTKGL